MPPVYDTAIEAELLTGMRLARNAIAHGELVVIPTDTVYGVAADAFDAAAVQRLLDAKGRGRQSPPPVLVPGESTLDALAATVPDAVRTLVAEFWPGGLTVVLPAQPSLVWDLGETNGTVALRMPSDRIALELLADTGPLAVSSANSTGSPAAKTAAEAEGMLGDSVAVYLDNGPAGVSYGEADVVETSSTIVDATDLAAGTGGLRILRHGVISEERIRALVPDAFADEVAERPEEGTSRDESSGGATSSDQTAEKAAAVDDDGPWDASRHRVPFGEAEPEPDEIDTTAFAERVAEAEDEASEAATDAPAADAPTTDATESASPDRDSTPRSTDPGGP